MTHSKLSSTAQSAYRRSRPPLVGRSREIAFLTERLLAAASGEGGVVLIRGEPGIGKSRLLAELAVGARSAGWLALHGHAYETEGIPPYLPFAEALGQYFRSVTDEAQLVRLASIPQLVQLLPELRSKLATPDRLQATEPQSERYLLFQNVTNLLLDIATSSESKGLLLCLDDLHWAEKSSLLLLQHLARKLSGAPLLVVGAYRTEEVDRSHPLFDVAAELTRERLSLDLSLTALSPEETSALVAALSGAATAPAVAAAIHTRTEGNPFFVEEVLRQLRAENMNLGDETLANVDWNLPQGVLQVIGKRLARLRPGTNTLLQAAAVLGDEFSTTVLEKMNVLAPDLFMDGIDEAVGTGIVRQEDTGYRFAHALIRQTVLAEIGLKRKQLLHLRAAEAIEGVHPRGLEGHLSALAFHLREAAAPERREQAIQYSLRAGEAALTLLAFEQAAVHWEGALRLLEEEGEPAREAELLERLGDLYRIFDYDTLARARECHKRAIRLYRETGQMLAAARTHARLVTVAGTGMIAAMDMQLARDSVAAGESALIESGQPDPPYGVSTARLLLAAWDMRTADGLSIAEGLIKAAEQSGDSNLWSGLVNLLGTFLVAAGRLAEGLELMERGWNAADQRNEPWAAFSAACWLGERLLSLADPVSADAWFQREQEQPREAQTPSRQENLLAGVASARALMGDLEEAQKLSQRASCDPTDVDQRARYVGSYLAWLWGARYLFYAGETERMTSFWSGMRALAEAQDYRWMMASLDIRAGVQHSRCGELNAAADLFRSALTIIPVGQHLPMELWANAELALVHIERSEPVEAETRLARCRAIVSNGEEWRGLAGMVARAEAAVAIAQKQPESAEVEFAKAVEVFRRYRLVWEEAHTLHLWGRACAAAGRRRWHDAAEKFDAAIAIYERHGAADVWSAGVRVDRDRARPSRRAARSTSLSERELQVLKLIVQGMSSREIGDSLFLSVRTVERHITNVYRKTDTHGRAQVTAYAMAHGLT